MSCDPQELDTVPFAALHDAFKFLIERFGISSVPSLGVLEGAKARLEAYIARPDAGWLVVSNPTEDLEALDECAETVAAELHMAPGDLRSGAAATAEVVLNMLPAKSHALFMCHGTIRDEAQVWPTAAPGLAADP